MQDAIETAVTKAGEVTARYLTSRLHATALEAGWPTAIAASLTVEYDGGEYDVHFPNETSATVWDLELESHVIQRFLNRLDSIAGRFYLDEAIRQLVSVGGI